MTTNTPAQPLGITDVVLRDAHQSLFATRMRIDDMLPITEKLDQVGFWSLETWGGATFDACIRFLGEDPWDRIREFKKAMPNTPQQMLLRGQNLLGYRHYADDVVEKFIERAATNGVDVFRIFDAMNDPRNFKTAIDAVKRQGKHAQGTLSYTTSPVHNQDAWLSLAKQIEDLGVDSLVIKDMAGIINPYDAFSLITRLKQETDLEIQLHCHATAGMSDMAILKAIEAGVDRVDTAISSMSMTYGHSATETVVAALQGTRRDTGLDLNLLEEIAAYFREIRKKYAKFEGAMRGTDSRILVAQVPGGMLTNMENQLREQGAEDKFDEVLQEIPRVRQDLGHIPLVTPTSQIVGTQAVLNVLTGERYKSISKETQGILKGEYGAAPAPYNEALQQRVLAGAEAITCRPADLIDDEMDQIIADLNALATEQGLELAQDKIDDALTYALFPQVAPKFLANRGNAAAFEAAPNQDSDTFTVTVEGHDYVVKVNTGGDVTHLAPINSAPLSLASATPTPTPTATAASSQGEPVAAPLAGTIWRVAVQPGQSVVEGDILIILEAMKMETEIRAAKSGVIDTISVKAGDSVSVGDNLLTIN
jgi:oxaloacetate decarboxylase alpha subunit